MTTDLPEAHGRALAQTRRFVAGVPPERWTGPTPCAEWDLRALVNHVVAGNYWVAPLVEGHTIAEVGDRYDGDLLGDDPLAAYDTSAAEADAAARAPGAMAAPCAVSYGPVPGEVYLGHRFLDVLVHGWDIARASGQDATLDPELAEICLTVLEPQRDMLEASGMFGHSREAGPGATAQQRLLATLGREP